MLEWLQLHLHNLINAIKLRSVPLCGAQLIDDRIDGVDSPNKQTMEGNSLQGLGSDSL